MLLVIVLGVFGCLMPVVRAKSGLCSVYEPFRVSPESATSVLSLTGAHENDASPSSIPVKFQIGGPFALHSEDCVLIKPDSVQEFIAIQWALTHWNQNPNNKYFKLAMQAGDTCSRDKETVSQVVRFLQSTGFYDPRECQQDLRTTPSLLGVIAPKDESSSLALASLLESTPLPLVTYSALSANVLATKNLSRATVVTTPTLEHYIELTIGLIRDLENDLVNVIYSGIDGESVRSQLVEVGIMVNELVPISQLHLLNKLRFGTPRINIVLCTKAEMVELMRNRDAAKMEKTLWIYIPTAEERVHSLEAVKIIPPAESQSTVVVLQERALEIPEFRDYFLDILHNNYHAYSLFAGYVQQIYNCTLTGTKGFVPCKDLTSSQLTLLFLQSPKVQSAILSTYVLAILGKEIAQNSRVLTYCLNPGPECTDLIVPILEKMQYTFQEFDPSVFSGFTLKLKRNKQGILGVQGLGIEAFQVTSTDRGVSMIKVGELATGSGAILNVGNFEWSNGVAVRSVCNPTTSECRMCHHIVPLKSPQYSVSVPTNYDLYIVGLFDLHTGVTCDESPLDSKQITLPMAFMHSLWTIKERYKLMNLLPNVKLGALVADTCSDPTKALKIVSDSTASCLKVNTAGINVTIHPDNIMGFVSAGTTASQSAVRYVFPKDSRLPNPPLTSISQNHRVDMPFNDFSTYPDYAMQAEALIEILKKFNWNFVSIILSERDTISMQAFKHFEKLATRKKICIAETIKLVGGNTVGVVSREGGAQSASTNVALVFATAEDTALFIRSHRDQNGNSPLLILTGDAHNWRQTPLATLNSDAHWIKKPIGAVSLQPRMILRSDFKSWLQNLSLSRFPEPWFQRYIEEKYECAYSAESRFRGTSCTGNEGVDVSSFGRMNQAGYLVSATEALIFATDAAYKKLCPLQLGLCPAFMNSGWTQVQTLLQAVPKIDSFQLYNYRLTDEGLNTDFVLMGNWSTADGLEFSQPWVGMDSATNSVTSLPPESSCIPPLCKCDLDDDFFETPIETPPMQRFLKPTEDSFATSGILASNWDILHETPITYPLPESWKQQTWTYIFLVVNSLLLLVALAVLFLVVFKMYQRVVKGNQSLGICLLCGVVLLYVSAYFFIFDPSATICRLRYLTHSLAYAVCFGCMIAKAMQLRNSETLGYNGYITYWNYWLLLFFITGVQLALNLQWLLMRQPVHMHVLHAIQSASITYTCSWSRDEFLLSHSYVMVLLILALVLALTNRGVKRNYKETKWLMYTCILCLPLWAVWMIGFKLSPAPFQEVVVVMELIACATVILSFMFGPKVYILLSYEPVLIEYPPGFKMSNDDTLKDPEASEIGDLGRIHLAGAPSVDLFDRDQPRAISPAGSSTASTKSTVLSNRNNNSSEDGESSPVFQQLYNSYQSIAETQMTNSMIKRLRPRDKEAVVRKKSRSKRVRAGEEKTESKVSTLPNLLKKASIHRKIHNAEP